MASFNFRHSSSFQYQQLSSGSGCIKTRCPEAGCGTCGLEEHFANILNSGRKEAGLKALPFRKDIRVRQEACSIAEKGADRVVGARRMGDNYWDVVPDPRALDSEIKRIATAPTAYDNVSVGVWYAANAQYPAGAYWVLIYPEHSAAYEAFWGHFYLTDSFQHITRFDKYWKKRLPPTCHDLK
jgi:hypothetical protein